MFTLCELSTLVPLSTQSFQSSQGTLLRSDPFSSFCFSLPQQTLIMNFNHDSSDHNQNQSKKRKQPDVDNYTSLELSTSNMNPRRWFFFFFFKTLVEFCISWFFQGLRHFIWLTFFFSFKNLHGFCKMHGLIMFSRV